MSTVQTIPLPEQPNLEQLKKRARELAREYGIPLNEAQLNLARGYGFASWTKLKKHIELVTELTRTPDVVVDHGAPGNGFLALACLNYGEGPHAAEAAATTLVADQSLRTLNVWTAAATASPEGVRAHIADARKQGGPFDWEPLMYLCHGRLPVSEENTLATATVLLDAGADPNAGYLWHGLVPPFTALTGVFGAGEQDQPAHPHCKALARLLLERGANPNDAQTLYNRQFRENNEHLELLFEFGLGQGDGGVWKKRLGDTMESPFEMVQHQLRWAIHHNMLSRVRLFCERGVDLNTPFDHSPGWAAFSAGRTPAEWAVMCGHKEIVDELAKHGAVAGDMDPVDQFVADVMAGRAPTGDGEAARAARPSLVVQAAATGRAEAVRIAVAHGFDINALGRADAPCEQPWQTALHTAVERNDREMVRLLLSLGAVPTIEDARYHATPAGWAEHFGREDVAALLVRP